MARKVTKEMVKNTLETVKRKCLELDGVILYDSDSRMGKRVALARIGHHGTVETMTDYWTYPEMDAFLFGYLRKAQGMFDRFS